MGWHFLCVVDERTNVASSYENQLFVVYASG